MAIILALIAGIFVTDRVLTPGVSASALYVIPIMLTVTLADDVRLSLRALVATTLICLSVSVIDFLLTSGAGRQFHLPDQVFSMIAQLTAASLVFMQIRSKERERRTRERAEAEHRRLMGIHEIGQVFASTLDLQIIYVAIQNRLSEIIDCATLLISLYDAETETIRCAFAYTDGEVFPPEQFEPLKLGEGPQSECIRTARPIVVDNIKKRRMGQVRYIGYSDQNPLSVLYVPMITEDRVVGVIQAQSVREGAYTEEDVPLLSIIANQAAIAILRARLYNEAVEGRREMEHANRIKDEFLAILSHELRTPLTPILGWARILKDLPPGDHQTREHAINVIERNANFQTKLVNDLLDMSRIESGKLSLFVQPLDLDAAVEATLESLRNEAAENKVTIEANLGSGHALILADPSRLEQIIRNLLTNAIKFAADGGRVIVATERTDDAGVLTVTDTGIGIAPDFLPHIFERFRQADSSTSRRHGGLGLGLSIVKSLVEMHGGQISVRSAGAGRGASFTVSLKLASATSRAAEATEQAATAARRQGELAGRRLVVVEDNPDTLDMMRLLCESEGIEVIPADTVEQALARISSDKPDLIISDISLPVMDGYEFARLIRADARLGNTPLIAITGMASDEDRSRALEAGFNAYLTKPIEPATLFSVLRELLTTRVVTSD
jgi:signal transduction histidine kinase/CheY-like chemotaxis protein